ncbi:MULTISPECIES: HNH endonuclease [Maribacter]|uniref:HNH endonuclease n=2 Tax=Maribacter TaxID=252356 RepID=A0A5R8MAN8_9FLAO|nr:MULTISPECIES: HNH endonuclease [Maribacter]RRQ50125.1 HNH endonuclease [Maribacter algicola]TLF46595.1 HNH endonuclease [Maribacter aurantiacus]
MANRWGIPKDVEDFVKQRDKNCVYCGQEFLEQPESRKHKPSWEHIVNDVRITGTDNISLCCLSCNASKGAKSLEEWFQSDYCNRNNINVNSVALVVKEAVKKRSELK